MTKVCSVCATENRDDAQFCRSCGTSFTASPPASPTTAPAGVAGAAKQNVCGECGFQNKPGIRYCANCGMSLTTAASGFGDLSKSAPASPAGAEPDARSGPPPVTYSSFAPVVPYASAPGPATEEGALFDELSSPDIPDPDAAIAVRQNLAAERYAAPIESGFSSPDEAVVAEPNRGKTIAIAVASALVVLGAAAWWFMGFSSSTSPAQSAAAPAPAVIAAPIRVPAAVASAPETAPVAVEAASAPPTSVEAAASAPEEPTVTPAATTTSSGTVSDLPPAAAAPLPQTQPPAAAVALPRQGNAAPVGAADAQAKRLAADKARREKAARDKAEREAKALAQRDQAAASAKTEQDAQARRRAEEAQRARAAAVPAPAPAPAAVPQPRGVREICAGRGTIAEAVCQSRQCAAAEHANDAICRRIREADERRRNLQS